MFQLLPSFCVPLATRRSSSTITGVIQVKLGNSSGAGKGPLFSECGTRGRQSDFGNGIYHSPTINIHDAEPRSGGAAKRLTPGFSIAEKTGQGAVVL